MTKRLTPEDLKGRKGVGGIHADSRTHAIWCYGVEGLPRLGFEDSYERRSRQTTRSWIVDGHRAPSLEAALAVINGDMTIEEAMVQFAPPAVRPKRSLTSQIADLDIELKRIADGKTLRKSEAELHVENLKAVRATLVWLQDNEPHIKQRMSY